MESNSPKSFWVQNAHLAIGSAVVLIAAVALTMLQVRSTSVVREAEATVNLADDVHAAMAAEAAPAATIALHHKMVGAIDASGPSSRVAGLRAELAAFGLLASSGDSDARAVYTATLRDASRAIRADATTTSIRMQQMQMGVIAGAAIILILLIRSVAAKRQLRPHPRRVHPVSPAEPDPLTGLGAIDTVRQRLGELLDGAEPRPGFVGLLIVGIQPEHERFLPLTREQLDDTLAETSRRLQSSVRASDLVARLARNELAVVMATSQRVEDPGRVARKLLGSLDGPLELGGTIVRPNPRVGVAIAPIDAVTPDGLIQRARLARRTAGTAPSAVYRSYRKELAPDDLDMVQLMEDLVAARAADDGQLWVAYQPKIDLVNERVAGFEALARWDHPRYGVIPPVTFIRAAEQSDLILDLGAWVLDRVCAQLAAWAANLSQLVPVSVNVSGRQLESPGLADLIQGTLEKHGVPPELLELELTEAILLDERPEFTDTLDRLSDLGVRIAVDDFTTAFSVLGHLKRFPIDVLKIDRTFIREIEDDRAERASSSEIIEMAHSMSLRVVAEGVETPEQLHVLRTFGCDAAQGFYFAHPTSAAEIDRRAAG